MKREKCEMLLLEDGGRGSNRVEEVEILRQKQNRLSLTWHKTLWNVEKN